MTVYGRIDIRYLDGRRATFQLASAALTIGSAPGNSIPVPDAALANQHIRFDGGDGGVYAVNLAGDQRTIVNGAPLRLHERRQLGEAAQIQIGELTIEFVRSSEGATESMTAISEHTQPSAIGIRAELESGMLKVWPFSSASVTLSVSNLTDEDLLLNLETAGLPADWTTPSDLAFSVAGGDSVEILLQIKPPRQPEIAPGGYPLSIGVARLGEQVGRVQLLLLVELGGYGGLSAVLDPPVLRQQGAFALFLLNHGNESLQLALKPCDPRELLDIKLAQDEVRLHPGRRAVISGTAALRRRPVLGRAQDISFALLAEADEPKHYLLALPASVSVTPLVPARAIITAAIAIVLLALALAAALYQPPQPSIMKYALSHKQVARGTPVALSWDAVNVERFVIEVARAPVAELPADAESYTLETGDYVDPIAIALIAVNGDATDIQSLELDVYQPVTVRRFEADKPTLLRGISTELTISWRVEGAAALDFALPVGFETVRESIMADAGEIVISGVAADDIHINLSAEDERGTTTRRAIAIAIRAPECTPIEDITLYAGPDPRFKRAKFAGRNVPVLVNGITADRDWLQVELASGDYGWGRLADFSCHGFNPAELQVVADIPTLPAPTPTSTAPPTLEASLTPSPTRASVPAGGNS
ncbi:MAG: hypothetical protein OXN88_02390 [Chloroflexota bacterium]|nr:hypothetical protein [Chloroflexota bacterium]